MFEMTSSHVPPFQMKVDASTACTRLWTAVRLSLLATHFERDFLGLKYDAHQANHFSTFSMGDIFCARYTSNLT